MTPPAPRWHLGALVLAGLFAFHNCFAGEFVFDDRTSIVLNPHVQHLWPPGDVVRAPLETTSAGRPLVAYSLALNHALGGLDPFGYHAFNLVVHLAAALVLYGLIRRTLCAPALGGAYRDSSDSVALAVALLWVVHPLQTESVTYIVQRAESMMGLCLLTTVYASARSNESRRPGVWRGLSVAACAAGMLCKENMVGAPLLAVLHDRLFHFSSWREIWRAKRGTVVGWCCAWGLLAACVLSDPRPETTGAGSTLASPLGYLCTQPGVLVHYLRLVVWPDPLVLHYDWPEARAAADIVPAGLVLLALLVATIWALLRRPVPGFWGAWYFVILAPTSSVLPIMQFAVEHRMYLPLASVWLVVCLGAGRIGPASLRASLLFVLVLAFSLRTIGRNEEYRWPERITRAHASLPAGALAFHQSGVDRARAGRHEEAIADYRRALELRPGSVPVRVSLGTSLYKLGRLEEAEAELRAVLKADPDHSGALYRLGLIRLQQGRRDEARDLMRQVAAQDEYEFGAHLALGMILEADGKVEEARGRYRHAALVPWDGQGLARKRLGRLGE